MSIIEQLQLFSYFTESEKSIIKVIFQDPDFFKKATSSELAKAAYTSASTVARLCQKLECKNYNDFKIQLISEMEKKQYEHTLINASVPFQNDTTSEDILKQITKLQKTALDETLALADTECFQKAVKLLAEAECIQVFGMGMNLHLAYDFAYKMSRIHRSVHISLDHQEQLLMAETPNPKRCAIVISYSGETPGTIRYASLLYKNKTPIISITNTGDNSIARYASERLYIATMEKQFSKIGPFASCTSIMAILNYLYALIFALDYDNNYKKLLSTVLSITEFRSNVNILRESK